MNHEIRFSTIQPDGRETNVRSLPQSDALKCPHFIIWPEHYRADRTCKCNDPDEAVMAEWGYKWDAAKGQWIRL